MNKYLADLFYHGVLSVLFVFISFLTYLFGKKFEWLVKRKILIGSSLLKNPAKLSNASDDKPPPPACYKVDPPKSPSPKPPSPEPTCYSVKVHRTEFTVDLNNPDKKIINFPALGKHIINGNILNRIGEEFSYRIIDVNFMLIQKGNIHSVSGKWLNEIEEFRILLDKSIKPGQYKIYFYNLPVEKQDKDISAFLNSAVIIISD